MDAFMKDIVDSYNNSKELENFVCLVGIENDSYVKDRIFTLMCQELFEMIDQDVQIPTPEPMDAEDLFPWIDWSQADQQQSSVVQAATTQVDTLPQNSYIQSTVRHNEAAPQPGSFNPKTVRPWLNDSQEGHGIPVDTSPPNETAATTQVDYTFQHNIQSVVDTSTVRHNEAAPQSGPSNPKYFRPWINDSQVGSGIPADTSPPNETEPYTFRKKGERVFAKTKRRNRHFK